MLESVNIDTPAEEKSRLYTNYRACFMPCSSAEKMLERLCRVQASLTLRDGMAAHVVVLSSSEREQSV